MPLEAHCGLHHVGRAQVQGLGVDTRVYCAGGDRIREEVRVCENELRLADSVEPVFLENVGGIEAVVEDSETCAQNRFGRRLAATAKAPSETQARSPVGMIADFVLRFEAQAIAERDVRADVPIVLRVEADVDLSYTRKRISGHPSRGAGGEQKLRSVLRAGG